jgi:hypothetical protein
MDRWEAQNIGGVSRAGRDLEGQLRCHPLA